MGAGKAFLAVIVVVVLAIGAGILYVMLDDESAGAEEGVTLGEVAADPRAYDGRTVTISGEIAENDYFSLDDAGIVFALGDDAEEVVLVYPQEEADLPPLTEDTTLAVTGTARLIEPNEQSDTGVLAQGGLLDATGAQVAILATEITVPAGDFDEEPLDAPVRRATVDQILADPEAWDERAVQLPGTVEQVGSAGFVLRGEGERIFVAAPRSDLSGLQEGDHVRIRADVWLLSQWRADTIPQALDPTPLTDLVGEDDVQPRDIPDQAGDVFLALRAFTAGGPQEPDDPGRTQPAE